MIKQKEFGELVVKHRPHAVIFGLNHGKSVYEDNYTFEFTPEEFKAFAQYLSEASQESWKNFFPKDATGQGSDYDEYYDKEYDNNGYLVLNGLTMKVTAPAWSKERLYQFNKPKMQCFIYDLEKACAKLDREEEVVV